MYIIHNDFVIIIIIIIIIIVDLSISALGILGSSSESLLSMLNDFNLDQNSQNYSTKKVVSIAIRCTYYVFCRRNKSWPNPDLLAF